jgi:hypothetical protein
MRKQQSRPDDTSDYDEDAENFDADTNQMDQMAYGRFEAIVHPAARRVKPGGSFALIKGRLAPQII